MRCFCRLARLGIEIWITGFQISDLISGRRSCVWGIGTGLGEVWTFMALGVRTLEIGFVIFKESCFECFVEMYGVERKLGVLLIFLVKD